MGCTRQQLQETVVNIKDDIPTRNPRGGVQNRRRVPLVLNRHTWKNGSASRSGGQHSGSWVTWLCPLFKAWLEHSEFVVFLGGEAWEVPFALAFANAAGAAGVT